MSQKHPLRFFCEFDQYERQPLSERQHSRSPKPVQAVPNDSKRDRGCSPKDVAAIQEQSRQPVRR